MTRKFRYILAASVLASLALALAYALAGGQALRTAGGEPAAERPGAVARAGEFAGPAPAASVAGAAGPLKGGTAPARPVHPAEARPAAEPGSARAASEAAALPPARRELVDALAGSRADGPEAQALREFFEARLRCQGKGCEEAEHERQERMIAALSRDPARGIEALARAHERLQDGAWDLESSETLLWMARLPGGQSKARELAQQMVVRQLSPGSDDEGEVLRQGALAQALEAWVQVSEPGQPSPELAALAREALRGASEPEARRAMLVALDQRFPGWTP